MKGSSMHPNYSYLDISEFILKEHSPCFRPKLPEYSELHLTGPSLDPEVSSVLLYLIFKQIFQTLEVLCMTPELSPKIQVAFSFAMTPVMKEIGSSVLSSHQIEDLDDFCLEQPAAEKSDFRHKKIKKQKLRARPRLDSTWHFVDDELEKIIEENVQNEESQNLYEMESLIENSDIEEQISQMSEDSEKLLEEEKQSTANFELPSQQIISLEWMVPNPKKELLTRLKTASSSEQFSTDEQKIVQIKSTIEGYIFDHEKFYFQETMNQLKGSVSSIMATLNKGIEQTFKRNIGGLCFEKRRLKLLKYMEKKKRRVWKKKVNYDCRKKVADGRLRIKGKFVTYEQACEQLKMASLEGYTADEVRVMLENRS